MNQIILEHKDEFNSQCYFFGILSPNKGKLRFWNDKTGLMNYYDYKLTQLNIKQHIYIEERLFNRVKYNISNSIINKDNCHKFYHPKGNYPEYSSEKIWFETSLKISYMYNHIN